MKTNIKPYHPNNQSDTSKETPPSPLGQTAGFRAIMYKKIEQQVNTFLPS